MIRRQRMGTGGKINRFAAADDVYAAIIVHGNAVTVIGQAAAQVGAVNRCVGGGNRQSVIGGGDVGEHGRDQPHQCQRQGNQQNQRECATNHKTFLFLLSGIRKAP